MTDTRRHPGQSAAPRLFRRSRRTADYLFIAGALDLVSVLALLYLLPPPRLGIEDGWEAVTSNAERLELLALASLGAASIGAGLVALRRRRLGIRVDDVGIEDLRAGTGPIPWGSVRDVETKTGDEHEYLILHADPPPGEIRMDIKELREIDRAEIFEAVLVRWCRATGRAR